jgi:peptidyl-prolyl cis-trans isomerase A (cyclophilin A)
VIEMKILIRSLVLAAFCGILFYGGETDNPVVLIKTELGDITVEIFEKSAPVTASNFLRYVDDGRFKESCFYRVVRMDNQPKTKIKIEVIQGGLRFTHRENILPSIEHETTQETGIIHLDGMLSMARGKPGTAASEFFICVGDQPELDFGGKRNPDGQGFAAFGKVVKGMDVVTKIHVLPTDGQMLISRVAIHDIVRLR